jgi:hypothetical protein
MGASGQTVLDLGSAPGVSDMEFTLTGLTGIADASQVDAWIEPVDTTAGWGCDALPFNGAVYLARGGNLTGIADSKLGILSAWVTPLPRPVGLAYCWFNGADVALGSMIVANQNTNTIPQANRFMGVFALGSAGANQDVGLSGLEAGPYGMVHILAAWDIGLNVGALYVNDVLIDNTLNRVLDEVIPYTTATDWKIGGLIGSVTDAWGPLAEIYFAPGQYLDLTVAANRRKFNALIADRVLPVSLGTDGSTPTGTAPRVYLHLDPGEAGQNFSLNRGTGGNFAWNGGIANVPSFGSALVVNPGHSADEHKMDPPICKAYSPNAAGSSMKIRLAAREHQPSMEVVNNNVPLICGKWNVGYVWS